MSEKVLEGFLIRRSSLRKVKKYLADYNYTHERSMSMSQLVELALQEYMKKHPLEESADV